MYPSIEPASDRLLRLYTGSRKSIQPLRIVSVRMERTTSERNVGSPPVFQLIDLLWGIST